MLLPRGPFRTAYPVRSALDRFGEIRRGVGSWYTIGVSFGERIGLEHPVVQAGMGGGLAGAELAAAVSGAGGLGTVGILPAPDAFAQELRRARAMTRGKPLGANLLLPFARSAHVEACLAARVDAVVMFCGS